LHALYAQPTPRNVTRDVPWAGDQRRGWRRFERADHKLAAIGRQTSRKSEGLEGWPGPPSTYLVDNF
jgi:hypothetical protein